MLIGKKVTKKFGGLIALNYLDFEVKKNMITGLIGPNGAGKTTLFNCITGFYSPSHGDIFFNGKRISGLSPDNICKLGIGRTFQIPRPFLGMTGFENVMIGLLYGSSKSISIREAKNEAISILDFVGLKGKENMLAKNYTLIDKKRLEIARSLATRPELILLDEVVAGLNPTETLQAMELVKRILKERGITVFWIEHVMKAIMNVADKIIVLDHGVKIAEGAPREVANDKNVIKSYLGERYLL